MKRLKCHVAVFLIFMVFASSISIKLGGASELHTPDPVPQATLDRAFSFLRDVVGLNMTYYTLELTSANSWDFVPELPSKQAITYRLISSESSVTAHFEFTDNDGFTLSMSNDFGSPQYSNPQSSLQNEAIAFLERYSNFSCTDYPRLFAYMLKSVDDIEPVRIKASDITLQVSPSKNIIKFEWTNTVDNIENSYNRFTLEFVQGLIWTFYDAWTRYPLPPPKVNLSQMAAIQRAQDCYLNETAAAPMQLFEKSAAALSMQPRDGKLYPQWRVYLPLPKTKPTPFTISPDNPQYEWLKFYYDGAIAFYNSDTYEGVLYLIWADTCEVDAIRSEQFCTTYAPNLGPSDDKPTIKVIIPSTFLKLTLLSPANQTYNLAVVPLTLQYNGEALWVCFSLDQKPNSTFTTNATLPELSDGVHNVIVYAMDWLDRIVMRTEVSFAIDTIKPVISSLSIENATYGQSTLLINCGISEPTSVIVYSLDGRANVTLMQNMSLTDLSVGSHKLTVYANDTAGNVGIKTVYFSISRDCSVIAFFALSAFAIIAIVGCFAVYLKRHKH